MTATTGQPTDWRARAAAHTLRSELVTTLDESSIITPFGGVGDTGAGRAKSLHPLDAYSARTTTWIHWGAS